MFAIRLDDPGLCFTAGHGIRYSNGDWESLHEHRFRVVLEISGPLNSVGYLFDFHLVRSTLREILDFLDGKTLLAQGEQNHRAQRTQNDGGLQPRNPLCLPLQYTTSEGLARFIVQQLRKNFDEKNLYEFPEEDYHFRIDLEESPGSWGVFRD